LRNTMGKARRKSPDEACRRADPGRAKRKGRAGEDRGDRRSARPGTHIIAHAKGRDPATGLRLRATVLLLGVLLEERRHRDDESLWQ